MKVSQMKALHIGIVIREVLVLILKEKKYFGVVMGFFSLAFKAKMKTLLELRTNT
jgi:hypothetical protein